MNARIRDLRGYGFDKPKIVWPNGARLAVSLNVNFEEGAEFAVGDGDPKNEVFGEVQSIVPPGKRDLTLEEVFGYGMRAALPRFLRAFEKRKIATTFMMCGRAVERLPEFAKASIDAGHEAALHGWRWAAHFDFDDAEVERKLIRHARDTIASVTGETPVGFMCRSSQSAFTRRLLAEEGFLYDSNALDDDLPYWDEASGPKPILVVPYAFDTNDMKFYHPTGFRTADEFLSYLRRALETLLAECDDGETRLLNVGLHLRIIGRPARFWALDKFLDDLAALKDRVWVARRRDIAAHWIANGPKP
jgi:peptidoglycan/xylan/chitin deacetylase (PgdA/CDA1 family)